MGTANQLGGNGNTFYTFNPAAPGTAVTELGVSSGTLTSFYDAGVHNGQYYTIPVASNQLLTYTLPSSGMSLVNPAATATLGGRGTNVTGLILGDIDFIGNSVYIYGTQVINGISAGSSVLYKYTDVGNLTAPALRHHRDRHGGGFGL